MFWKKRLSENNTKLKGYQSQFQLIKWLIIEKKNRFSLARVIKTNGGWLTREINGELCDLFDWNVSLDSVFAIWHLNLELISYFAIKIIYCYCKNLLRTFANHIFAQKCFCGRKNCILIFLEDFEMYFLNIQLIY